MCIFLFSFTTALSANRTSKSGAIAHLFSFPFAISCCCVRPCVSLSCLAEGESFYSDLPEVERLGGVRISPVSLPWCFAEDGGGVSIDCGRRHLRDRPATTWSRG